MNYPRLLVLLVALAAISRSPAVAEQRSSRADETLTIGVTVDPTCTVAVTPGEREPAEAIGLACRNFREGQPAPLVLEAAPRDGHEVVLIRF